MRDIGKLILEGRFFALRTLPNVLKTKTQGNRRSAREAPIYLTFYILGFVMAEKYTDRGVRKNPLFWLAFDMNFCKLYVASYKYTGVKVI